jgi:hypothetical protein
MGCGGTGFIIGCIVGCNIVEFVWFFNARILFSNCCNFIFVISRSRSLPTKNSKQDEIKSKLSIAEAHIMWLESTILDNNKLIRNLKLQQVGIVECFVQVGGGGML